jgi:hypothetical protein
MLVGRLGKLRALLSTTLTFFKELEGGLNVKGEAA